jgi:hypothetical protein
VRYVACGGDISNLADLANWGICEFQYVVPYNTGTYGNIAAAIKAAGLIPVINEFNDNHPQNEASPGVAHFQALKDAGWVGDGGEGCSAAIVSDAMLVFPWCNYGGIESEQQSDMYAGSWNHPASGGFGHVDYIESYNNNSGITAATTIACMQSAKSHGSKDLGLMIGTWMSGQPLSVYTSIINTVGGVSTICFWNGYNTNPWACVSAMSGLKNIYGVTKSGYAGGAASTSTSTTTTTTGKTTTTTTGSKPVVLQNPATPRYKDYSGFNYSYTGKYIQQAINPKLKWQLWLSRGTSTEWVRPADDAGNYSTWKNKLVFKSKDPAKAALLELSGTIDRSVALNTFDLTFLQNSVGNKKFTDYLEKNQRVKLWLGYDDTLFSDKYSSADAKLNAYKPPTYIFGGYISDVDRYNTMDGTIKVTVSGWERAMVWSKYKVTCNYEWIELGYLLKRIFERPAPAGLAHFEYANTGIIVDRYVAKNKRLSECFDEILGALDGFKKGSKPPTTYTPSDDPGEGMGQLYSTETGGRKKAEEWDFWMDEEGNGWLLPLFKQSDALRSYKFKQGVNLISFERQKKDEFDIEGLDVYTVEIPFVPELNIFNNNLIEVFLQPADDWEKLLFRVDGIEYNLDGTMKLTCRRLPSKALTLTLKASGGDKDDPIKLNKSITLTATATDNGKPVPDISLSIYHIFNGEHNDDKTDTTDDKGEISLEQAFKSAGIRYYAVMYAGNDEFKKSWTKWTFVYVKGETPANVTYPHSQSCECG